MGRGKRQARSAATITPVSLAGEAATDEQRQAELKQERARKRKWAKLLKDNFVGPRQPNEREVEIFLPLLEIGGTKVVVPYWPDGDLETVAARGQLFAGKGAYRGPGKPIQCHRNAVYLWADGQKENAKGYRRGCRVATGYALSQDGYWRQHSWCVAEDGKLIETTVARVSYYGVVLSDEEAQRFYELNR